MGNVLKVTLQLVPQPEGGFVVTSPDLPELVTEGQTPEEVLGNVRDALEAVIELYQDMGKSLPENLNVNAAAQSIKFETLVSQP